jgi:predicted methyltransferase
MNVRVLVAVISLAIALATPPRAATAPSYIANAVADTSRPQGDIKLDADRKPAEVMAYAGVKPGQTIGEYLPGGGYYTRLLSNVVGRKGKVYALETTTWDQANIDSTKAVLTEPGHSNVVLDLSPLGTFNLPEKIDLFWTSLNYHDLHIPKYANVDMAAFNKRVFASLKPGGIYFIVDHAAAPGTGTTLSPTLHRIDETTVINEVTAAGFWLVGESDILRNPSDDHTKIVFDPSIRFKTDSVHSEVQEALESVRKHQGGLQSFRNMRRIEARCKNASALRLRFSQSLASLRQRFSHAIVRSTIHRFGRTTKVCNSLRLTTSMTQSPLWAAASAARGP